jgi:uncharacterized protein YraI
MNLRKTAITLGLAVLTLGATAASAYAAAAFATGSVNVRSGPGTGYRVVDQLNRGEQVDVRGCQGNWCRVVKAGPDGWVSASYLSSGGYDDDDYYDDDYYDDDYRPRYRRPRVHFNDYYGYPSTRFCVGGNNASFCISD